MKNDFESWLDLDSSNQVLSHNDDIQTPIRQDYQWQQIIKPEQKQVISESIEAFPSVKRKYEQKFTSKAENSTSQSPCQQDQLSSFSEHPSSLKYHRQNSQINHKQHIKKIEEQNRYLKQKVDDLSFRLRQTEIELNKLKYSGSNNIANFESMKQAYIREITHLMESQKGHEPQTCQVFKKLRELTEFDGKLKVDLLNYFMSELLENIINDSTFYYLDIILNKKGLWKQTETQTLRKVDQEVIEIAGLQKPITLRDFKNDLKQTISMPAQKYKDCWKSFYRSYIALLNQGFVLQNFLRLAMGKIMTYIDRQNIGKVELHFQKIKLRKDIRILRQSWFKQIQYDQQNDKKNGRMALKKIKPSYA